MVICKLRASSKAASYRTNHNAFDHSIANGKTMVAILAIQLDVLIDNSIYTKHCCMLPFENPLILGNDFCISYRITLDLA